MSNQDDQTFTDEPVSHGYTTRETEQIPVVEDSKYQSEGVDAVDEGAMNSDQQLGKLPQRSHLIHSRRRQGGNRRKE